MKAKIIKTEAEYTAALARVEAPHGCEARLRK